MDEIIIVGTSKRSKFEKLRLPSVNNSRKKFLNLSQNILQDYSEETTEKKNLSFSNEANEAIESSRVLTKIISLKKNSEREEISSNRDIPKPNSPGLMLKGIVTPTHTRILKPIVKKQTVPIGIAKKKKPLKLLSKILPQISRKNEIFMHFSEIIRKGYGIEVVPIVTGTYKYYIGKGNNGSLVNHLLKSRFWWNRVDDPNCANLVWTQLKHKATLERNLDSENIDPLSKSCPKPLNSVMNDFEKISGISLINTSELYHENGLSCTYTSENLVVHNRLPNNFHICNKKSLFKNLKEFYTRLERDVFEILPCTYHIENGASDENLRRFVKEYKEGSVWIIKPGEWTNRGNGIQVSKDLEEIKEIVSNTSHGRTFILQKYIENPLLINKRKFDIRCYVLVTYVNGVIQGYFYKEGYLRTTSKEFTIKNVSDKFIHLTNDAIQKNSEDYGKFESGNKLSYSDFQRFLSANHPDVNFHTAILEKIEKIVAESISAVENLVTGPKKNLTFEVFGYDFMVDDEFKVWLIEVNTNPCLELSCSYLAKLIPEMLENAFKIALDPIFPPPLEHKKMKAWVEEINFTNKFSMVLNTKLER